MSAYLFNLKCQHISSVLLRTDCDDSDKPENERSVHVFLVRDVIYTSRAYATNDVSVRLSVHLSVMEIHW